LQLREACLFAGDRDKKSDISNRTATDDADDDDDQTMLELDRWYLNGNGTVAPAEVDMVPHTLNPVLHILFACLLFVKKPCTKTTPTARNSGVMSICRFVVGQILPLYRRTPLAVHFSRLFLGRCRRKDESRLRHHERYVCDNCLSPSFFRSVVRDLVCNYAQNTVPC
jgi:hypothetical protein